MKRLLLVPLALSSIWQNDAAPAPEARTAEFSLVGRICWDPLGETEEQRIERHVRQAVAVFTGFVRARSLERANVLVLRTWKGDLGAEVVMATGTRDNGDGTHTLDTESFPLRQGETYLLFGYGKSTDSMAVSVCEPNGLLKQSARTVAILDKFVKGGK